MTIRDTPENRIESILAMSGWSYESVYGLPRAFTRSEVVTPALTMRLIRRMNGYVVDGELSVIDKEFEKNWQATNLTANRFCIVINIVNVSNIQPARHIAIDNAVQQEHNFCRVVSEVMERMPENRLALNDMLDREMFLGEPMDQCVAHAQEKKFAALKSFVSKVVCQSKTST